MCLPQPDGPVARGGLGIFRNFHVLFPAAQPDVSAASDTLSLGEIRAERRAQQGQPPCRVCPAFPALTQALQSAFVRLNCSRVVFSVEKTLLEFKV